MTEEQVKTLASMLIEHNSGFSVRRPEGDEPWRISFMGGKFTLGTLSLICEFATEHGIPVEVSKDTSTTNVLCKIGYNEAPPAV